MTGSARTCSPLWQGDADRSVTAKLSADVHAVFEIAAHDLGTTKGALARMLIKQFVDAYKRGQMP